MRAERTLGPQGHDKFDCKIREQTDWYMVRPFIITLMELALVTMQNGQDVSTATLCTDCHHVHLAQTLSPHIMDSMTQH